MPKLLVVFPFYEDTLHYWVLSLTKFERNAFAEVFGFHYMFGWVGLHVNWAMLRAASHFWSIRTHLFNFSMNELCPTHEEFCAMVGMAPGGLIAVPSMSRPPVVALQELLGIDGETARLMLRGQYLDLTMLPVHFAKFLENDAYLKRRQSALFLCLLAKYFFIGYPGFIGARVIDIVLQRRERRVNMIPFILAETLFG